MKNTFLNLIKQSYNFPQKGFDIKDEYLYFHGVSIKKLINKYSTPFKVTFLPSIDEKIKDARNFFNKAMQKNNYNADYKFCYCTKCCHFQHVISEALKHNVNLETSSSFDIDLILKLYENKELDKNIYLIHNGYKTDDYIQKIIEIQNDGFVNSTIILDSTSELKKIMKFQRKQKIKIGLRMAISEAPQATYHTSRLGISPKDMIPFFENKIKNNDNIEFKQVHFFIDSGIKDSFYFWGEFKKAIKLYIELKKKCKTLSQLNIGGGFPIRNKLNSDYDYEFMIQKIVKTIKYECSKNNVPEPDIFTEFGKYTVGESSANIFEVIEQKQQNDTELWYIVDNSIINIIPDSWTIQEKFILLPINKWKNEYTKINIGGISCDSLDYYNSEDLNEHILLPKFSNEDKEPMYLGFFHTGAYQDAISGYGGIKHCLIPSPKQIIIKKDANGNLQDYLYRDEQNANEMLKILGYL